MTAVAAYNQTVVTGRLLQSLEEERKKAVNTISGQLHSFCPDSSQMSIPFEHEEGWVN
jgi:hypothetical protein